METIFIEPHSYAPSPAETRCRCSFPTPDVVWTVGAVTDDNGTLSTSQVQEGGDGWTCQRALTVRNNVAVDIVACADRRFGFHSSNGYHGHFDTERLIDGPSATDTRIQVAMRQEEDPRWGCAHAMAIEKNVVVEARLPAQPGHRPGGQ